MADINGQSLYLELTIKQADKLERRIKQICEIKNLVTINPIFVINFNYLISYLTKEGALINNLIKDCAALMRYDLHQNI